MDAGKSLEFHNALYAAQPAEEGTGYTEQALLDIGIEGERIVGIPQGWRLNGAIKTCERRLAGGELVHARRPLMAWCVGNCRIEIPTLTRET